MVRCAALTTALGSASQATRMLRTRFRCASEGSFWFMKHDKADALRKGVPWAAVWACAARVLRGEGRTQRAVPHRGRFE